MHLLDLPLEVFQNILCESIKVRGVKRGVRLRLVNKLFAQEVVQVLFVFRLLDTYFASPPFGRPPFTAAYLEYRVRNEHKRGFPNLVYIRHIAERLSHEPATSDSKQDYSSLVKQLCTAVTFLEDMFQSEKSLQRTHPWRLPYTPIDKSDVKGGLRDREENIFVAAVITQTMSFVRRWINAGNNAAQRSYLFGSPCTHAVESKNEELVELLLSDQSGPYGARHGLLFMAAELGRFNTVQFIFSYKAEQDPWVLRDQRRYSERQGRALYNPLRDTPSREVYGYIMELRKIYPVVSEYKPSWNDYFLRTAAIRGWTDKASFLLDLGARVNGPEYCGNDLEDRPIILACKRGYPEIVELLLEHDADSKGTVEAASEHGHLALVQALLKRGVIPTGGLNKATAWGYRDIVEFLLDHGSDVKEISPESFADLVALEHTILFRLLHERGAMLGGEIGTTCLKQAREMELDSMVQLLKECGVDVDVDVKQTSGLTSRDTQV